jgi:hypothetical protein
MIDKFAITHPRLASVMTAAKPRSAIFIFPLLALLNCECHAQWAQIGLRKLVPVQSFLMSGAQLYAATAGDGVRRSSDSGATWTDRDPDFPDSYTFSFAALGTDVFIGSGTRGVLRSSDDGVSWTDFNNGLTYGIVWSLAVNGADLFAGMHGGVFRSTDNGATWSDYNTGWTTNTIRSLIVIGARLIAGTDDGAWIRTLESSNSVRRVRPSGADHGLRNDKRPWRNPAVYGIYGVYGILGNRVVPGGSNFLQPLSDDAGRTRKFILER